MSQWVRNSTYCRVSLMRSPKVSTVLLGRSASCIKMAKPRLTNPTSLVPRQAGNYRDNRGFGSQKNRIDDQITELRSLTNARTGDQPRRIRSADSAALTSPGLTSFRALLKQSQQERRTLLPELQVATAEATRLERQQGAWDRGWLLRRLFPGRHTHIRESATEAKARKDELKEQERLIADSSSRCGRSRL